MSTASLPRETDGALLARLGTDAEKWTREFLDRLLTHSQVLDPIDEGWVLGWFANAIEAGRSAGIASIPPIPAPSRDEYVTAFLAIMRDAAVAEMGRDPSPEEVDEAKAELSSGSSATLIDELMKHFVPRVAIVDAHPAQA